MGAAPSPALAIAALNACTILWGTQHAVVKSLVVSTPLPTLINAVRFSTAAVVTSLTSCAVGGLGNGSSDGSTCGLLLGAAELAVWQTLGFTFQLIGLHWTTASRSAFLLYLNETMVPMVALLLREPSASDIGLRTWVCALVAVAGTLMLVNDNAGPNVGDAWSVCAALASAVFIVRIGRAGGRGRSAAHLSAATQGFSSLACWAFALADAQRAGLDLGPEVVRMLRAHWAALLYLSLGVSALAGFLQAWGQRQGEGGVPPHVAAVIFTLDPCWAALFSYLLLGERLYALGWAGICLVVGANVLRKLPWREVPLASRLVTPEPSVAAAMDSMGGEDSKRAPLLGTPQTPAWLQKAWRGAEAWRGAPGDT